MQYNKDISLIINQIKFHLGYKTDSELAEFLGTTQSNIATWKKRNTINYDLIIAKCPNIDANWLLTGEGNMLKSQNVENISTKEKELLQEEILPYGEDVDYKKKYIQLLEKYNSLLEGRISDWLESKQKS